MIVTKKLVPCIQCDVTIESALKKVSTDSRHLVFCLPDRVTLENLLTDGDFRSWIGIADQIGLKACPVDC